MKTSNKIITQNKITTSQHNHTHNKHEKTHYRQKHAGTTQQQQPHTQTNTNKQLKQICNSTKNEKHIYRT